MSETLETVENCTVGINPCAKAILKGRICQRSECDHWIWVDMDGVVLLPWMNLPEETNGQEVKKPIARWITQVVKK